MHQFGWLSERGGQLFEFASERGEYPESRGGGSLRKEGEGGGGGSNPGGNYGLSPIFQRMRTYELRTYEL